MARLSVSLLGPLEVTLDGEPVTRFASNKVRALLAYLAVEADRPHRREVLATLLWPDWPDRAARTNLRHVLSNLRHAIGDPHAQPPFLTITREAIQFNCASDCWVDVAVLRTLVEADQAGGPVTGQLEEAMALYRGPFLEGFYLKGCPAFDDWSLLTREKLHRQILTALHQLAEQHERQGELEKACEVARRQVELEPWQEEARRRLMRLLALRGQRSAALAQYEACRRTLMDELGVEPAEETRALYERIRDGADLPAPSRGPPHNLPTSLIPFVGRERLLADIRDRLQDPTCRLLSLVGPGGSGKTRLALETAARQLAKFRHGAFFVSLAALQSVDGIVPTITQALDVPLTTGAETDPQQRLLDYLRCKQLLLILDNFEHLLEGVGLATQILRRAPDVKVIATSRARLNARGEHLMPVPGMDVPPPDAQETLSQYSAVQLFLQSARQVRADFDPTAEELGQVARICQLVEGMPLAILIAASWVSLLTPGEIMAQISSRSLDFLETEWRDVPPRQRSMRAVFDHSWNLLSQREREVFARVSVFRGGFLQEAAQEVAGASLRELMSLADRSLLQRTASGRYEVHELVRQYAEERLADSPLAQEEARDRHCAYFAAALQEWEPDLRGPRQVEALTEIAADVDNARVAWEWAVERGNIACLAQALDGLGRFYERDGRFQQGEAACRLLIEWLQAMQNELGVEGLRLLVRGLAWRGLYNRIMGRSGLAREVLEQALTLLDQGALAEEDTRSERAFALEQMGHAVRRSDLEMARCCWEESLTLHRALADTWAMANVLSALGIRHLDLGERALAEPLLQESLALRRSLDDRTGIADSLIGLSYVAKELDRYEEAERLAREAAAIRQEIGDRVGLGDALRMVWTALITQGRFAGAHSMKAQAVTLREELGMRTELVADKHGLAWTKVHLGWYAEARELEVEALALAREVGRPALYSLLNLAGIALVEGAYDEAREILQQVTGLTHDPRRDEYRVALAHLTQLECALGRPTQARRCLREALKLAHQWGTLFAYYRWLPRMALFLAGWGEVERAVELYALAARFPFVGRSRYWEDIVGRHIAAAAATLPPEVVTSAQERGQARDLEATIAELLVELEAEPEGG